MRQSVWAVALPVLVAAGAAWGQGYTVLRGAPVEFMTQEDLRIYQEALNGALEKSKDGAVASWENRATRAGGSIQTLRSFRHGGQQCRELYLDNQAKGRREKGAFSFCKDAEGAWKLAPGAAGGK
jgi:surface antigen